jgi:exopolysaccharide production protein ExoZ
VENIATDTKLMKELIAVQYMRGLAAAIVVLHHLLSSRGFETRMGAFGVDIFFVISGFIMWHTTAAANSSTFEFWRRRLIRIVPLYWFFLCAMVIVALFAPQSLNSTVVTPENTIKSFLFIPHYHATQHIIAPILIPGWSLDYEMFFYFLFGLALLVPSLRRRAILLGVVLAGLFLLGVSFQPTGPVIASYTSSGLLKFFDGIILAMIYRSNRLRGTTWGLALISVGLLSRLISDSSYFGELDRTVGLSPMFVVAGALALEPAARRVPSLIFLTIGNASYSIYLSHQFFVRLLEIGGRHLGTLESSAGLDATYIMFALIFAVAGGIVVYYLVERPMLFLFRKRSVPIAARTA